MPGLSILEGPYGLLIKIGAAIGLATILFGSGYYEGHKHAVNAEKARVVDHVIVQVKAIPGETKIIHDKQVVIQTVHDKVYVDVVKTVRDNRACDVPAAGVGLLNANRSAVSPAP